jgi:2-methylcitrate dehydratase PrpD
MPFCAAAAVVFGAPGVETFDVSHIRDARVQRLMPRVTLRANPAFDAAPPLSQARVSVQLRDGRTVSEHADGARGYPGRLTDEELNTKFRACARRSLGPGAAEAALTAVRNIDHVERIGSVTAACARPRD